MIDLVAFDTQTWNSFFLLSFFLLTSEDAPTTPPTVKLIARNSTVEIVVIPPRILTGPIIKVSCVVKTVDKTEVVVYNVIRISQFFSSISIPHLDPATTYNVTATYSSRLGESPVGFLLVTTLGNPPTQMAPPRVAYVGSVLLVTWEALPSPSVLLEYELVSVRQYTTGRTLTVEYRGSNASATVALGAGPAEMVGFQVRAVDEAGDGDWSEIAPLRRDGESLSGSRSDAPSMPRLAGLWAQWAQLFLSLVLATVFAKRWRSRYPVDKWEVSRMAIVMEEQVGQGAFGIVTRSTMKDGMMSDQVVAVKQCARRVLTEEEWRVFEDELSIAKLLSAPWHKNVIYVSDPA
jgi:hypothetical protein